MHRHHTHSRVAHSLEFCILGDITRANQSYTRTCHIQIRKRLDYGTGMIPRWDKNIKTIRLGVFDTLEKRREVWDFSRPTHRNGIYDFTARSFKTELKSSDAVFAGWVVGIATRGTVTVQSILGVFAHRHAGLPHGE